MKKNKILIIGQGSISKRLIELLIPNCNVFIYQHRQGMEKISGTTSVGVLDYNYHGVIIATPTYKHIDYLEYFAGKTPIFIEKPIVMTIDKRFNKVLKILSESNKYIMCGFQLRYVPVINKIDNLLNQKKIGKILSASLYVGQYLPFWRPGKNYDQIYSAKFEEGGGVALDLIHEIDLACRWFTLKKTIQVESRKLGDLNINTENYVHLFYREGFNLDITLDSLNHNKTRIYNIIGDNGSIFVDLYNNVFLFTDINGNQENIKELDFFDTTVGYKNEIEIFLKNLNNPPEKSLERWLGIDALKYATHARLNI